MAYGHAIGSDFRVMHRLLHLSSLKVRPLELDQMSRLFRSFWSKLASWVESTVRNILVSSAKHARVELITASGRSLTYNRKSIGPKMLPCGTPEHTGFWEEVAPRAGTRFWRPWEPLKEGTADVKLFQFIYERNMTDFIKSFRHVQENNVSLFARVQQ